MLVDWHAPGLSRTCRATTGPPRRPSPAGLGRQSHSWTWRFSRNPSRPRLSGRLSSEIDSETAFSSLWNFRQWRIRHAAQGPCDRHNSQESGPPRRCVLTGLPPPPTVGDRRLGKCPCHSLTDGSTDCQFRELRLPGRCLPGSPCGSGIRCRGRDERPGNAGDNRFRKLIDWARSTRRPLRHSSDE